MKMTIIFVSFQAGDLTTTYTRVYPERFVVLDLRPDWDDKIRTESEYNLVVHNLEWRWHGLWGARDLDTYAYWATFIDGEDD
jgi:hypothetical protein